jgi:hypothetical protein
MVGRLQDFTLHESKPPAYFIVQSDTQLGCRPRFHSADRYLDEYLCVELEDACIYPLFHQTHKVVRFLSHYNFPTNLGLSKYLVRGPA